MELQHSCIASSDVAAEVKKPQLMKDDRGLKGSQRWKSYLLAQGAPNGIDARGLITCSLCWIKSDLRNHGNRKFLPMGDVYARRVCSLRLVWSIWAKLLRHACSCLVLVGGLGVLLDKFIFRPLTTRPIYRAYVAYCRCWFGLGAANACGYRVWGVG